MRNGFDVEMAEGNAIGRLYRTAEAGSPQARLVSRAVSPDSGRACLLLGRLHYKEDLARAIPALAGQTHTEDAALALAVFEACGWRGLARLEGEFSLVVIDPTERCFYLLRDPMGSWPLYWVAAHGRLFAGTSLLDLARRSGETRINLDLLGQFLMWTHPGGELPREDTALEPICRVAAGRLVQLRQNGKRLTLHAHAWPCPVEGAEWNRDTAGQRFLELFQAAVRQRLEPGRTVAHLSGGMDSSSIVCVARDLLKARQEVRPLDTLSLVYRVRSLAGETPYIHMVLNQGGPLAPRFLDGDGLLAFDWFSSGIPEHDEPYGGLHQLGVETGLVQAAQQAGAARILCGDGAELVSEAMGYSLADVIRQGRWIAALREAQARARAYGTNLWSVLYLQGLKPQLPSWLHNGVGTALRFGWARWPTIGESAIAPWVRPWFASKHRLWKKGRDVVRKYHRAPYEESACRFFAGCLSGEWGNWYLAGPRGMHSSRPFLDPRLVNFSLALPQHVRFQAGVAKPLLQSAMKGVLPEPIRTRLWKRHFNDVHRLGLSRRLGELDSMVARSAIADLDVLDRKTLRTALAQVAAGLGQKAARFSLNNALALIAWYDHLGPALARAADQPAEVVRCVNEADSTGSGRFPAALV
jgi:asparagine synthase (glutamine-hydrolysing)